MVFSDTEVHTDMPYASRCTYRVCLDSERDFETQVLQVHCRLFLPGTSLPPTSVNTVGHSLQHRFPNLSHLEHCSHTKPSVPPLQSHISFISLAGITTLCVGNIMTHSGRSSTFQHPKPKNSHPSFPFRDIKIISCTLHGAFSCLWLSATTDFFQFFSLHMHLIILSSYI